MKMKLGLVYLTGGPNKSETLTLGFWDEESRGSPYKYVRIPFKIDMSIEDVESLLYKSHRDALDLFDGNVNQSTSTESLNSETKTVFGAPFDETVDPKQG